MAAYATSALQLVSEPVTGTTFDNRSDPHFHSAYLQICYPYQDPLYQNPCTTFPPHPPITPVAPALPCYPSPLQQPGPCHYNPNYHTLNYHITNYPNPMSSYKIFPRFSDKEKGADWLKQVEQYFTFYNTEEKYRVDLCLLSLKGEALQWYREYKNHVPNHQVWQVFKEEITIWFNSDEKKMPCEATANLKQTSIVKTHLSKFEQASLKQTTCVAESASVPFPFAEGRHVVPEIEESPKFEEATVEHECFCETVIGEEILLKEVSSLLHGLNSGQAFKHVEVLELSTSHCEKHNFELQAFTFLAEKEILLQPRIGLIQDSVTLPTSALFSDEEQAFMLKVKPMIEAAIFSKGSYMPYKPPWPPPLLLDLEDKVDFEGVGRCNDQVQSAMIMEGAACQWEEEEGFR